MFRIKVNVEMVEKISAQKRSCHQYAYNHHSRSGFKHEKTLSYYTNQIARSLLNLIRYKTQYTEFMAKDITPGGKYKFINVKNREQCEKIAQAIADVYEGAIEKVNDELIVVKNKDKVESNIQSDTPSSRSYLVTDRQQSSVKKNKFNSVEPVLINDDVNDAYMRIDLTSDDHESYLSARPSSVEISDHDEKNELILIGDKNESFVSTRLSFGEISDRDEQADEFIEVDNAQNMSFYHENSELDSSEDDKKILIVSLFSGMGIMELPFKYILPKNGYKIILYVEKDEKVRKIFQKNFDPDKTIKLVKDINTLDTKQVANWIKKKYPNNKLIYVTAGFPCTTFSIIGKKQGMADENTNSMFKKVVDLLKEIDEIGKEFIFLMENVNSLAKSDFNQESFKKMKDLLLFNDKMKISRQFFNSINFNVPQKRERLILTLTNRPEAICIPKAPEQYKNYNPIIKDILEDVNYNENGLLYSEYPLNDITKYVLKKNISK